MPSTQGPFFFPMAHFVLFVFTASTIFHLQQRLVKIQPPLAAQRLEPAETEDNASRAPSAPSTPSTPSTPSSMSSPSSTSSTISAPRGMWTINAIGRLGNQMGEYATLYALAKMNGRPAFIPAEMHSSLAPIFRISLPVLHGATANRIPWRNYHLNDWMEEQYRHLPWEYVRLTGYPCSWTFYHHLRPEILREFTLHDHVREAAQRFLRGLQATRGPQLTFVGVHVRRGDYVRVMPRVWKGVLADRGYLRQALDWFRARHPAPVFVVTSDDMAWCRRNINSSLGDVVFAGDGRQGSPAKDFALLTQCNHTVFTVGTFGVWAAYLAGGDAVYLANFTLPHSRFRTIFKPQAAFLPQWVGIAANLGPAGENSP